MGVENRQALANGVNICRNCFDLRGLIGNSPGEQGTAAPLDGVHRRADLFRVAGGGAGMKFHRHFPQHVRRLLKQSNDVFDTDRGLKFLEFRIVTDDW